MKRKRGFTLIELLAVIVILAIIALVAIPVIASIINSSKENSAIRSAELYSSALIEQIQAKQLEDTDYNPSSCTISSSGTATCGSNELKIVTEDTAPTSGTINISNGKISNNSTLKINGYCLKYTNGKWTITECESSGGGSSTAVVPPDECFVTKLYSGSDLTDFNDNYGTNYTTPIVSIVGYSCGNTVKELTGMGSSMVTVGEYNNDGQYTNIKLPNTLPVINSTNLQLKAGFKQKAATAMSNIPGRGEVTVSELDWLDEATDVSGLSSYIILYSWDTSITDSTRYPVVAIEGNMTGLESVELNDNMTVIGNTAFASNELTTMPMTNNIVYIGMDAYINNKLTTINIGSSVRKIDYYAFSHNNLSTAIIPENVKEVCYGIFSDGIVVNAEYNNANLTTVTVEGKCSSADFEEYEDGAFDMEAGTSPTVNYTGICS